jgi:cytochrome c2
MKKPLLVIGLLIAIVYACNHGDRTINKLLSPGKLPAQTFVIDITKDTVLTTQKGALIRIPKDALKADNNIVKLEVKEAYSMEDIVKAGLTTTSNGKPLRSGGMFYLNPVGDNKVTITQPISIATPTAFLDSNMKLFKGEVQGDSTINWTDPKPMPENPQLNAINKGKIFFQNCASCHSINKDLTGPALKGAMQRLLPVHNGNKKGIYAFIRNPAKVMARVKYYQDLKTKFGGAVMTTFPNLTDADLDNLFAYIENESNRTYTIQPNTNNSTCLDSCVQYLQAIDKWSAIKSNLESKPLVNENVRFTNDTPAADTYEASEELPQDDTTISADPAWEATKRVLPSYNTSFYYQFTIDSFGWYNIDCYLNIYADILKDSELKVKIPAGYKENISMYLIMPSVKTYVPGGLLENKNDEYGFDQLDGSIRLPHGARATVIVVGEKDGDAIFGKVEFIIKEKQLIELPLKKLNKETLEKEVAKLRFNDLKVEATKTNTIEELKNATKELEAAEQLKPQNCDCDSLLRPAAPAVAEY